MIETGLFSRERLTAMSDWLDDYLTRGEASMYRFLSCRVEGQIIGWSCYGPHWLTDSVFDVYGLGVAPNRQRQGVGAALLRETERHICALSGDLALVELSGSPRFQSAHRFLDRHGFRLEAAIADFYAEGESQLIYAKKLDRLALGVEIDFEASQRMRQQQKESLGYGVEA